VKRLNGMDAMLFYSETPNLHTQTLKVAIIDPSNNEADFDGEFTYEVFRHHVRSAAGLSEHDSGVDVAADHALR
jgi:diacylglycerol O-acyltransferase / wax synthase